MLCEPEKYTCSPYQYYFVDSFDQIYSEDIDGLALNQTVRVESSVTCDLYNSCKKNPYVASLASGQSAVGFLEFMGSNAVQTGKVKISFDFTNDPQNTLMMDMYPCDLDVNGTLDGYEVESCTWNYCESACKPVSSHAYPQFFDGFNVVVVVIVYVSLIILSVIIYFVKKKWQSDEEYEEMSGSLDDSKMKNLLGSGRSDEQTIQQDEEDSKDSRKDMSGNYGRINQSSLIKSLSVKLAIITILLREI